MPTFSLATSLKNKLGGGSGRGGSPQAGGGSSPQPRVSFIDSADPPGGAEATGMLPPRDMDAELRASPACQRKSAAGAHELEEEEEPPSLDSVFARRSSLHTCPPPEAANPAPPQGALTSPQGWGWDTGARSQPRVLGHASDPLPPSVPPPTTGWITPHQRHCTPPSTSIVPPCWWGWDPPQPPHEGAPRP